MKGEADILGLGMRFDIESPHTGHVAKLALDLFDGFSPIEGLCKRDRQLLFAAAHLHDIAYSINPEDHVIEGARVLSENPLDGYSGDEWLMVIGIALLHKRDWRTVLEHELFPEVGRKTLKRIKQIAAILRIADGLDHGHIQDAEIIYCRRGNKADKVGVVCDWYQGNIPWAESKADLWESIYKRPFRFEGRLNQSKKLFKGVVHRKDSAYSAARRILYSQWCVMRDCVPVLLEGRSAELHQDYCAALLRFLDALEMFRTLLDGSSAAVLGRRLDSMSEKLKPVCSSHAGLHYLQTLVPPEKHDSACIKQAELRATEDDKIMQELLRSDFCLETVQLAGRVLRIELPKLERDFKEPLFTDFALTNLEPTLNDLSCLDLRDLRKMNRTQMLDVKARCLRGQHFAEFSAPVLGKQAQRAARRLKAVCVGLDELFILEELAPLDLPITIRPYEKAAWLRVSNHWQKFVEK